MPFIGTFSYASMILLPALYRSYHFLKHYIISGNEDSIHSHTVSGLYKRVIQNQGVPVYTMVDEYYFNLLENPSSIKNETICTGDGSVSHPKTRIHQLAKRSIEELPWRQLICRLVHERKPEIIVEVGTHFGVSTAYIALTCPRAHIYTFETNKAIFEFSRQLFQELRLTNITAVYGDLTQASELLESGKIDVAYINNNYCNEKNVQYSDMLLSAMHQESLLIMDNPYWSLQMTKAWNKIRQLSSAGISIDLWKIGIVYAARFAVKAHYRLKY